jgi:hypothetical protein
VATNPSELRARLSRSQQPAEDAPATTKPAPTGSGSKDTGRARAADADRAPDVTLVEETRAAVTRPRRLEARRVRRLIRHIDPWSVLKLSILFFLSVWLIVMIAAVIVWTVAQGSGTVEKIETFVQSNLGVTDWKLDGEFLFRQFGLVGLIITLGAALAATIASVVFNLISDIIGGVWVTVIEEETARPRREP